MTENEMKKENFMEKTIEELCLSDRAYNSLTRAGIRTIGEIENMTDEELIKVRNLGQKGVVEIRQKIASFVDGRPDDTKNAIEKKNNSTERTIEEMALSTRSYNSLRRAGIKTEKELAVMTDSELLKIRNLGQSGVVEIRRVISQHQ